MGQSVSISANTQQPRQRSPPFLRSKSRRNKLGPSLIGIGNPAKSAARMTPRECLELADCGMSAVEARRAKADVQQRSNQIDELQKAWPVAEKYLNKLSISPPKLKICAADLCQNIVVIA